MLSADHVLDGVGIRNMSFTNWRVNRRQSDRGLQASLSVDVICIDTGDTVCLTSDWLTIEPRWDEVKILHSLKSSGLAMVAHELLEHFGYLGIKSFDPHVLPRTS